ncbi:MAG: Uma2 family endonuclease [Deltaproteobacteria bacterium]|nr:Uma2 family endonuclease [Deltaproteobacteria bacterium]
MTSAAQRPLITEEEFLRLPESTSKIELVDGEVVVSSSPGYWHQEVLARIVVALRSWASKRKSPVTVGQAPLDMHFAPGRILQPDAFVLFGRIPRAHQGPIDRVPELCIEVLSSDRLYDRVTKRLLYAAAGVQEYWVVEPAGAVERWSGRGLARAAALRQRLATPLLPGFDLNLPRVFATKLR